MSRTEFPDQIVDFRVNTAQAPPPTPGCQKSVAALRRKPPPAFDVSKLPSMIALPQGGLNPAVRANKSLPAGFVILGQFLSHDISIDRLNEVSPTLQLQSLYGNGASANPYLYVHLAGDWRKEMANHPNTLPQRDPYFFRGVKLMLRHKKLNGADRYDVARTGGGLALMADNRNDQHFLILQLHVAFIRFHNAVVDYLSHLVHKKSKNGQSPVPLRGIELFQASRRVVIALYHQIVVDYLKRSISDPTLVDALFADEKSFKLFDPKAQPELMPEFADAALRMGHSQVSEEYSFPNHQNRYIYDPNFSDLRGYKDRIKDKDTKLEMYWRWFFDLGYGGDQLPSSAIDTKIVTPISELPFFSKKDGNMASRDLARAHTTHPGRAYASIIFSKEPHKVLSVAEIANWTGPAVSNPQDLPLWAYLLLEAQLRERGKRLGPLGSQILAEQVVWVLRHAGMDFKKPNVPELVFAADGSPFNPATELTRWRDLAEGYLPERRDDLWGIQDLLELPNFIKKLVLSNNTPFTSTRRNMQDTPLPSASDNTAALLSDPGPTPPNDSPQNFAPSNFAPTFNATALDAMFDTDALYDGAETIMFYFSQTAVASRANFSDPQFDEDIDGITLFLGIRNNQLVAVARATNSRQVFFADTDYFISGDTATYEDGDPDFKECVEALIDDEFNMVKELEAAPTFSFKKSQLYALLCTNSFSGVDADVTFTVFTGIRVPNQVDMGLPGTYLNAYLTPLSIGPGLGCAYSFTHPKYCYYPRLNQPGG